MKPVYKKLTAWDRKALKGAVDKYTQCGNIKEVSDIPEGVWLDASDCRLCSRYFERLGCKGCPVSHHTGKDNCQGTPYYDEEMYENMSFLLDTLEPKTIAKFKRRCLQEAKFLQSLLDNDPGNK